MSTAPASAAPSSGVVASSSGSSTHQPLPSPIQVGETHYTHTTFLTTLTDAFAAALKATTEQQLNSLPEAERNDIVPEYYIEATRQALKQVLAEQYSPGQLHNRTQLDTCEIGSIEKPL